MPDTLTEPDETFTVNLGNPVNATLAGAIGTATTRDRPQTRVYAAIILH